MTYETKREVVPGNVVKVTFWNGKRWYTTYEAHPEPDYDPPKITCCDSAIATSGAHHAPDCKGDDSA